RLQTLARCHSGQSATPTRNKGSETRRIACPPAADRAGCLPPSPGSISRASTRSPNTASPPAASSSLSTRDPCERASSTRLLREDVIGNGPPPAAAGWAAPNFPDSGIGAISCCTLPVQVLVMDFLRSPVPERRMETSPIIPELDVPRNVFPRFPDRRVRSPVHPLDFHCGVERFRESIVETRPGASHGLADSQPVQDRGELGGRVIAAAVRVEDSSSGKFHVARRHLNRAGDQRCPVIV